MSVIGIDIGTTNSLVAVYRNGRVELIPNRFGSFLTPSVVSVADDGQILVGEIAKERLITHPEASAASFKKDMGTEHRWRLAGKEFLPEELSSFVVRSIVEDAERYLGEKVEEAIISVPAYFHDQQRVATKSAGMLAGVRVSRIINEPSAAALASYFDTSREQMFLVFDFGGGTLDVSVVDCFDTMVEILSVSGDNRLGGDNFHEVMAESFLREHQIARSSVTDTEYAVLLRQAEKCKRQLSVRETAQMSAVIAGNAFKSEYTNERLLQESAPILNRIKRVLTHALQDGQLTISDIDAVIMAGGSSKMPVIQSYLQHLFGQTPIAEEQCDELIARGLGLVCAVKQRREEVKDYVMTDICPFTLGISTFNAADQDHSYMTPIVTRNTVLPCSRVKRFYTVRDNQEQIEMDILQGERPYAEDNLCLGKLTIPIPAKKKGEEAADIRFTYDLNGILIVDVTIVSNGKKISRVLSQKMDEKEMARRMSQLEKLKVHPKDMTENKLVMEKLYALYEEFHPDYRDQVQQFIQYFEYLLSRQNPRQIKKYRSFLENVIDGYEEFDPFAATKMPEYRENEWEDDRDGEQNGDWEDDQDGEQNGDWEDDWNGGNGQWTS